MNYEVACTATAEQTATECLRQGQTGVYALWRPSYGTERVTALVDTIIPLPKGADPRQQYRDRAAACAARQKAGLALLRPDAYRAETHKHAPATGKPLVVITRNSDGHWSAQFHQPEYDIPDWCSKVRVIGPQSCQLHHNDISRLRVGVIGLGRVGNLVAETLARSGVKRITLIDHSQAEIHYPKRRFFRPAPVVRFKADLAQERIAMQATVAQPEIKAIPLPVQNRMAYRNALDCDLLFGCADQPLAHDVLNYIASAHLIPAIDCGTAQQVRIITPYHQCLLCNSRYGAGDITPEPDSPSVDPAAAANTETELTHDTFHQTLATASTAVNLALRYLIGPDQQQPDIWSGAGAGETKVVKPECEQGCAFQSSRAMGENSNPQYLIPPQLVDD